MNRRGFLASLAAIATAPVAFLLPSRPATVVPMAIAGACRRNSIYGTVGGINRATFSFWHIRPDGDTRELTGAEIDTLHAMYKAGARHGKDNPLTGVVPGRVYM